MRKIRYSCLDCDCDYGPPFIWLPNDLWKNLGLKPKDFLCGHCIIDRIYKRGMWVAYLACGSGVSSNGTEIIINQYKYFKKK